MKHFVYRFTFPNGKVYIGSTQDIDTRWQYSGTLYKKLAVGKAIDEFGWENVKKEVVFFSKNGAAVEAKEKELIAEYGDNSYNCADNPNWKMEFSKKPVGCKGGYVHVWTINGETKTAGDWCKIYGKDLSNTLAKMRKHHMTPLEALSAPKVPRGKNPAQYWRDVGFVYGKDKSSYITPLDEWPEDIEKAEEISDDANRVVLSKALKIILKRSGLTQKEATDNAGRSVGTVARAIATNNITLDSLISIAGAMGYEIALINGNETPIVIVNPGKISSKQKRTVRPGQGNGLSEKGHS